MKHRLTISVDEETILKVRESLREGHFRNKSHVFEYAVNKLCDEGKNDL